MIKKRIMIVGPGGSGKSTLANIINQVPRKIRKTQDVIYGKYTIDTPSVYLELPFNYKFLVAIGQEANVIICVIDPLAKVIMYPPYFVKSFNCKYMGIITKIDLADEMQLEKARKCMEQIGIEKENILEMNLLTFSPDSSDCFLKEEGHTTSSEKVLTAEEQNALTKLLALREWCRV